MYSQKAAESGDSIHIIGGQMGPAMIVENLASSLVTDYEVLAHEVVCALANSADDRSKCCGFRVNYSIAHAVVIQIWHEHASAADSDVHPVEAKPPSRKRKADQASDSDVHPARVSVRPRKQNATDGIGDSDAHPAQCKLSSRTPLWDNVLAKLDEASSSSEGQQLMNFINEKCFFGNLCYRSCYGEKLTEPMTLSMKMECLLETAAERRKIVLKSLSRGAAQPALDMNDVIPEKDMITMWNDWKWDVQSWMNKKNLERYWQLSQHKQQQMRQKLFSAFRQHLSGCKFLLHKLIQLPIIDQCNATSDSAAQPASIMTWIEDLRVHMESAEYKAAVEQSRKKAKDHQRLSKQICNAQWNVGKGKELSQRAKDGDWKKLKPWEQELVEKYDTGRLEKDLQALLDQKTPIYRGVGVSVQPTAAPSSSSAVQPAASSSSAKETH